MNNELLKDINNLKELLIEKHKFHAPVSELNGSSISTHEIPALSLIHLLNEYAALLKLDNRFSNKDVREFLENTIPNFIQRNYPFYQTHSLIIKAWTASLCQESTKIKNLQWINTIFKTKITDTRNELEKLSEEELSEEELTEREEFLEGIKKIKSFFLGNSKESEKIEIPLKEFFKHITITNSHSEKALQYYYDLLEELPKLLYDYQIKDLIDNESNKENIKKIKNKITLLEEEYNKKAEVKFNVFWMVLESENDKSIVLILGVKISSITGIKILSSKFNDKSHNRHDAFAVYSLKKLSLDSKLSREHFISIQGLFIPIDTRQELFIDWKKKIIQAESASLVSRNISHNLGSHAMIHIMKSLNQCKISNANLVVFLDYLNNRSALIAELSVGSNSSFKVNMTLNEIINEFNKQKLLLNNLCLTENFEISSVVIENISDVGKIELDIPSGKIGCHAFYAIIENFARNSAKHDIGKRKKDGKIKIRIGIEYDENEKFVKFYLWDDNSSDVNDSTLNKLKKTISHKTTKNHFNWKRNINDDASYSLGHAEMKTWAAYLRGVSLFEEVTQESGIQPLLLNYSKRNNKLCLEFYLLNVIPIAFSNNTPCKSSVNEALFNIINFKKNTPQKLFSNGRILFQTLNNNNGTTIITPFGKNNKTNYITKENKDKQIGIVQKVWLETMMEYVFHEIKTENGRIPELHIVILDNPLLESLDQEKDNSFINIPLPFLGIKAHIVKESEFDMFLNDYKEDTNNVFSIFNRHKENEKNVFKIIENSNNENKIIHYESYSEHNNYTNMMSSVSINSNEKNRTENLFGYLAECSLSKVMIVDDRGLIENDETEKYKQINRAGIYLLDPKNGWEDILENNVHEHIEPAFPIHRKIPFIFETVHASLNKSIYTSHTDEGWNDFIAKRREIIPYFSLHSGRGSVTEQYDNIAFFPVYIIKDYGTDKLSKFNLITNLIRQGIAKVNLL